VAWLQISLTVDASQVAAVEGLFTTLGALSVTDADAADQPLLEPGPGETPLWNRTRITALFEEDQPSAPIEAALQARLSPATLATLEQERLEDQVWERVWLQDFHPMRFGRRLWVCPAGQRPEQADALVVDLDPGLAFGTGTHPTTALCLRWLDEAVLTDRLVVDFGCGSGILAIAAALLGAREVLAVDHDPQALKATRDNAEKNQVLERIRILAPEEVPARSEERRVGKECRRLCRSRWSPYH
jgi:ribosomal protein L11 methyltransferase